MTDVFSILSANYKTVGMAVPSKTPYTPVDPALYQGDWTGKYADNKSFKVTVTNITGFRAKVHYQSGSTNKYSDVLIRDNAFRIGDMKFMVTKEGTAVIKNVVTNPATGGTMLDTAYAKQNR